MPQQQPNELKEINDTPLPAGKNKLWFVVTLMLVFGVLAWLSQSYLNLDMLAAQEIRLKELYAANPILFLAIAFLFYVLMTGLSIPGATVLTLTYSWFLGFTTALILISFASTAGATLSFLSSRYLLRDWIQNRYGEKFKVINEAFDREGNLYLFMMRLIPAVPFFMVNLIMGLTHIKTTAFWWVSQLGMLAGTIIFVYAGSRIPKLETLQTDGINAVFSPQQMLQIFIALAMLGLFPIVAKKIASSFQNPATNKI